MKEQPMGNKLLLLFGMSRSGTTWLGKILDSHPDALYLHEPDSEIKIKSVPLLVTNDNYSQYRDLICRYCSGILNRCTIRINGKTPFFKKSYLSNSRYAFFKFNLVVAKIIGRINIILPIWNPFKSGFINNCIFIWKSIESCGRVGLIMDALPECKIIYVIRHPCGQIASVIDGEKSGKFLSTVSNIDDCCMFESLLNSNYARQHNLSIEKIKSMKPIERIAMRWVLYNEQAIEDIEKTSMRAIIVRYDDICKDTVKETKKLFEFAGLSWTDQTKQFIEKSTLNASDGYYSVFKNPEISMSKWKNSLSREEIEIIKKSVSKSKAGAIFADSF
jgi:hypothetical protein